GHGTGGFLLCERVADALQLGNTVSLWRRQRWRWWRRNDPAFKLDRAARMKRERHLGSVLCPAGEERSQDEIGPCQQRGDDGRYQPNWNSETPPTTSQRLAAPVGRQVAHRLGPDPAERFIQVT